MKNKRIKNYLKFGILLFGISAIVIGCQKDDNVSTEQNSELKIPQIETISYDDDNTTFNNLKSQYNLDRYKATKFTGNIQAKSTTDTLGLVIETDIIKQATLGNYTSYTMKIVHQNDSTVFYNLTIEYKNGESDMFITKYTPTEYWINNKDKPFQGEVQSKRATLTQYTDPEETFEESYTGNPELGSGPGGGGGAQYGSDYPVGCLGTVVVTTELVPYPCGCGHMPEDNCSGCGSASPQWPGYDQVTLYACEESWDIEDPYDPGDTGNPGGGSLPDPIEDDPSITVTIRPEECTERIDGDLDGDCALSPYEFCMLGNNSQEICDCVADDNTLAECIEEDERNRRCNQLQQIANNGNWTNRMQELRTATTGNTEILYYGNIGNDGNMDYSSGDRIESDNPGEHGIPNHTISNPTDSFIHNHFQGGLPVFSPGDLYSLWTLYDNNLINNADTFVMYLTTTGNSNSTTNDDTLYALTISDINDFLENGAIFLNNETSIDTFFYEKGISTNISADLNEKRLLEIIKDLDLGLNLYRGDIDDFTNWSQLKLKNDKTIKEKNCN